MFVLSFLFCCRTVCHCLSYIILVSAFFVVMLDYTIDFLFCFFFLCAFCFVCDRSSFKLDHSVGIDGVLLTVGPLGPRHLHGITWIVVIYIVNFLTLVIRDVR